jgi:hypothetical protein
MKRIALFIQLILLISCSHKTKEELFWDWFVINNENYYINLDSIEVRQEILKDLSFELKKYNDGLTYEFSPIKENQKREFTISADGNYDYFTEVIKLVNASPHFENWEIIAFRQRVIGDDLQVDFTDLSISYSDIYFNYELGEDKLKLNLYIKDFYDNKKIKSAVFILLDGLIGYDFTTFVSSIDFLDLNDANIKNMHPLIYLREVVDSIKIKSSR